MNPLPALQVIVAAVLAWAAAGKLQDLEDTRAALRLTGFPPSAVGPVAVGVPAAEVGIALLVLSTSSRALVASFAAAVGLFLAFTMWMLRALSRGQRIRCSCFGTASKSLSGWSVARNASLLAVAALGTALAGTAAPLLEPFSGWTVLAASEAIVIVASVATARANVHTLNLRLSLTDGASATE